MSFLTGFDPASGMVAVFNSPSLIIYPDLQDQNNMALIGLASAPLLASGDLDGDNRIDVVALTQPGVSMFRLPATPADKVSEIKFISSIRIQYPYQNNQEPIKSVAVGDLDQDQRPDLIIATQDGLAYLPTIDKYTLGSAMPITLMSDDSYEIATGIYLADVDDPPDGLKELILVTEDKLRIFTIAPN